MKKKWLSWICLIGIVLSLLPVQAEEKGNEQNRVSSVQVTATLNPDKTVRVHEEGILWPKDKEEYLYLTADKRLTNQKFSVEDLVVKGIPVTVDELEDNYSLKIMEEKGDLQSRYAYSMDYTLRYYEDGDSQTDSIDVLLVPFFQDFSIEGMNVRLEAPKDFQRDNWAFGCKAERNCNSFTGQWAENVFEGGTTKIFDAYNNPKLTIHYLEGSFQNTSEYLYKIVYYEMKTDIEILNNFDILVSQHIKATLNDDLPYLINLEGFFDNGDYEIQDMNISDPDFKLTSEKDMLRLKKGKQEFDLQLSYKVHFTDYPDYFKFNFIDPFNKGLVEKMSGSVQFPDALEVEEQYYNYNYDQLDKQAVEWSQDRLHYSITNTEMIEDTDTLKIRVDLESALDKTPGTQIFYGFTLLAIFTFMIGVVLRLTLKKTKTMDSDIPKRINPIQARLLKGLVIRPQDFRYLIFHWISEGNIVVDWRIGTLELTRKRELAHCPQWEKDLFDSFFNGLITKSVRSSNTIFTRAISEAILMVKKENKPHPVFFALKHILIALIYIPILISPIVFRVQNIESSLATNLIMGILFSLPLLSFVGITHFVSQKKMNGFITTGIAVIIFILSCFVVEAMAPQRVGEMLVLLILSLANITVVSKIQPWDQLRMTKYYDLINWIAFLNLATDRQITNLLDADADYALKAYPYTAALEEKRLWENRFAVQNLPTMSTVFDQNGEELSSRKLDELSDELRKFIEIN